jgi:hypothetical protein
MNVAATAILTIKSMTRLASIGEPVVGYVLSSIFITSARNGVGEMHLKRLCAHLADQSRGAVLATFSRTVMRVPFASFD